MTPTIEKWEKEAREQLRKDLDSLMPIELSEFDFKQVVFACEAFKQPFLNHQKEEIRSKVLRVIDETRVKIIWETPSGNTNLDSFLKVADAVGKQIKINIIAALKGLGGELKT